MYLSAQDIAAMEGERRVHFVNPSAVRSDKSLGDAVGLRNIGIHIISIAPGDRSTEFHAHHYEEEALYVLSGHGTAVLGETTQTIGPGDFIGFPTNGVAHETINDGTEPLVCLVVGQRLQQEVVDYPRKGKRLYRHGKERNVVDRANIEQIKR
jgi:uncharacterized cupin superfamily protein